MSLFYFSYTPSILSISEYCICSISTTITYYVIPLMAITVLQVTIHLCSLTVILIRPHQSICLPVACFLVNTSVKVKENYFPGSCMFIIIELWLSHLNVSLALYTHKILDFLFLFLRRILNMLLGCLLT